jgi:hypothetical protein
MVVEGVKDGSEKASPTSPLAKSSESSTGTIIPFLPSGLAIEQDADVTRERLTPRSICVTSLLRCRRGRGCPCSTAPRRGNARPGSR